MVIGWFFPSVIRFITVVTHDAIPFSSDHSLDKQSAWTMSFSDLCLIAMYNWGNYYNRIAIIPWGLIKLIVILLSGDQWPCRTVDPAGLCSNELLWKYDNECFFIPCWIVSFVYGPGFASIRSNLFHIFLILYQKSFNDSQLCVSGAIKIIFTKKPWNGWLEHLSFKFLKCHPVQFKGTFWIFWVGAIVDVMFFRSSEKTADRKRIKPNASSRTLEIP